MLSTDASVDRYARASQKTREDAIKSSEMAVSAIPKNVAPNGKVFEIDGKGDLRDLAGSLVRMVYSVGMNNVDYEMLTKINSLYVVPAQRILLENNRMDIANELYINQFASHFRGDAALEVKEELIKGAYRFLFTTAFITIVNTNQ